MSGRRSALTDELVGEAVEKVMQDRRLVGVAVDVAIDGRQVLARGYGLADRSAGLPVTADTVFRVGSTILAAGAKLSGLAARRVRSRRRARAAKMSAGTTKPS